MGKREWAKITTKNVVDKTFRPLKLLKDVWWNEIPESNNGLKDSQKGRSASP